MKPELLALLKYHPHPAAEEEVRIADQCEGPSPHDWCAHCCWKGEGGGCVLRTRGQGKELLPWNWNPQLNLRFIFLWKCYKLWLSSMAAILSLKILIV